MPVDIVGESWYPAADLDVGIWPVQGMVNIRHLTCVLQTTRWNMVALGTEKFTYEVVENWAKVPEGWSFKEVGGVGVDAQDNVYVFNRGLHPMMVFDRDGNFLRSWGEGTTLGPTA